MLDRLPLVRSERLRERTEVRRRAVARELDPKHRAEWGQFFTPTPVADFLARLIDVPDEGTFHILDPGAGVGSLTTSLVARAIHQETGSSIRVVGFEADARLIDALGETFDDCERTARRAGVSLELELRNEDFLDWATGRLAGFSGLQADRFDACIMNPPYRKISSRSTERALLNRIGVTATNLYTAFLAASTGLLNKGGQLSTITPRSFANGPYFLPFRQYFLGLMGIERLHVYGNRKALFSDGDVLQENVILKARRGHRPTAITISTSVDHKDEPRVRSVPATEVVSADDPQQFIRIPVDEAATRVASRVSQLPASLDDLKLQVSTGRVVDFRSEVHLVHDPHPDCAPLVYPTHLRNAGITWPALDGKKANCLAVNEETEHLLLPTAHYVLVKRFSSKEEARRVTASHFAPHDVDGARVAFENHLNVFHWSGAGLDPDIARGLTIFLNSSLVDTYVRLFSGHTQINATDLRLLRYPSRQMLAALAAIAGPSAPLPQAELDRLLEQVLPPLATVAASGQLAA